MIDRDQIVTEDELHAYVDGELPAERRGAVEARLASHPDDAARVAAWRSQAELIRARYGAVDNEKPPQRLDLVRLARRRRRGMAAIAAAAVVAAFLAGGGVGSLVRYLAALAVNERYDGRFPLATFLINVTGSFVIGLMLVLLDREDLLHPNLRPLLVTGFLGGYTTFSSFGWETAKMLEDGEWLSATSYVAASVVVGLFLSVAGIRLANRF